jgi:hypothetical protein
VHVVSWRARGLRLREIRLVLALAAKPMLPSHATYQVGISIYLFEAQYPAHQCPCLRFDGHLAITAAKLGVRMVRYSFPVGLFHPLLQAKVDPIVKTIFCPQ